MTELEAIQLSNEVAKLYGIYPITYPDDHFGIVLIDDWQRLMPLAIEHGVGFIPNNTYVTSYFDEPDDDDYRIWQRQILENYKDRPTKERAVAVAILKALKAKKEK